MRRFSELLAQLEHRPQGRTAVPALQRYFAEVAGPDPASAAAATWLLDGALLRHARRLPPRLPLAAWREAVAAVAGLPDWLFDVCHHASADLGDTLTHLLPYPPAGAAQDLSLAAGLVAALSLASGTEPGAAGPAQARAARGVALLQPLASPSRLVLAHVLCGQLRTGVSRIELQQVLAELAGVPVAAMSSRLQSLSALPHPPTAADWTRLMQPQSNDAGRHEAGSGATGGARVTGHGAPLPSALDDTPWPCVVALVAGSGEAGPGVGTRVLVQWCYRGQRAQAVRRGGTVALWSHEGESLEDRLPEVQQAVAALPASAGDLVLDGVLLAWRPGEPRPMPPVRLARRLQMQRPTRRAQQDAPVRFVAFDLLAQAGVDWRTRPLRERLAALQALRAAAGDGDRAGAGTDAGLDFAPAIGGAGADGAAQARALGHDGVVVKALDEPYDATGHATRWHRLAPPPLRARAVLVYAEWPAAGGAVQYSFAVWNRAPQGAAEIAAVLGAVAERMPPPADPQALRLVPVARLPIEGDAPLAAELARCVRETTVQRFGPVASVLPTQVVEIEFAAVHASTRHKSGLLLAAPRLHGLLPQQPLAQAATLAELQGWL